MNKITKTSILRRKNRKYWYVRYQTIFEIEPKEESTKVLIKEKTLRFMNKQYIPAWIAKKEETLGLMVTADVSFQYYADVFLSEKKALHDFKNIEYNANRILKDFSKLDITKVTKLEIKLWINNLLHKQTSKALSKNTKGKFLSIFNGIFEHAYDNNVIESNFIDKIKITGTSRDLKKTEPFYKWEVSKLLEFSKDDIYGEYLNPYLGIAFYQGMSPAEILGLQIKDINLDEQIISIKRNVTKGKDKETKNTHRTREIPIFDLTIPYIQDLLQRAKIKKSKWLFSKQDGYKFRDIESIRGHKSNKAKPNCTKWYKLLKNAGIRDRNIKNTRHTFTISAIESNAFTDPEIANILGHGSLAMIQNHYAKWIKGKALSANKKVDIFSDTRKKT